MIKIIQPLAEIIDDIDGMAMLKKIEMAGRTCYKSEDKITDGSAIKFVRSILKRGHESVIEHEKISARVICDRGVSHEIVRHRIASYSQTSTRYCDYNGDMEFIDLTRHFSSTVASKFVWKKLLATCDEAYKKLRELGESPQIARSVLPNSLKTELVMTMNLREWRHFFRLRTSKAAHPQIREIANDLLNQMREKIPVIFDDIGGIK